MHRTRVAMKLFSVTLLASISFGCSLGQVQGSGADPGMLRFDAGWWKHVSGEEQQGFIYGYQNCCKPPKAARASVNDYLDFASIGANHLVISTSSLLPANLLLSHSY